MAHPPLRSIGIALLAALACGDPRPGDSDGAGSTGASDPGTTTGDGSATATGPGTTGDPGTATGAATTTDATTGDATTATTTATTTGTTDTTTGTTDTTGGPLVCELVHLTCARAELNRDFEDCGIVDPTGTTEQWQAARDCALAAAAEQRAFKLVTWLQGIDSDVGYGYVGQEGVTYGVERLFYDSFIDPTTTLVTCSGLAGVPNCTVEPGEACLDCEGASESEQLCP